MCGTFDPPHIGHLILAQLASNQVGLDKVLFMPVGDPTHKSTGTPIEHRLEMARLAIKSNSKFEIDELDATRPEPHYTATLLPLVQSKYPDASLWLLIGGDSLESFLDWHQPEKILDNCMLTYLPRPGYSPNVTVLKEALPIISEKLIELEGPSIYLSSTWLRQQFRTGPSPKYLVDDSVIQYAENHAIYA